MVLTPWGRRDSNPQPRSYKDRSNVNYSRNKQKLIKFIRALPLELHPLKGNRKLCEYFYFKIVV